MAHRAEQLVGRGGLDDPPRVHHVDPAGAAGDHSHVVGDEQRRHPQPLAKVVEQRQDLGLDRHVERGRRLVGEQYLRLAAERDRDHHALTKTSGELVRIIPQALLRPRQPDELQHLERALDCLLFGGPAVEAERFGDLLADRLGRVQRRLAVLEDHRDVVAANPAQLLFPHSDELAPVRLDRAADDVPSVGEQPEDRQRQHRLART